MHKTSAAEFASSGAASRTSVGIALAVLIVAGAGHRQLLAWIQTAMGQPLQLLKPLSTIPLTLSGWQGIDEPIDDKTQRIANEDDFVNRVYRNTENGRTISLYIGYIGRPRTWMSHRPDICYRGHGFEQLSQNSQSLRLPDGSTIPCFVYEFKSPQLGGPRQFVLATYLFNGQFLSGLDVIADASSRRIGLFGKRASYLARIQVSIAISGDREKDLQLVKDYAAALQGHVIALLPRAI